MLTDVVAVQSNTLTLFHQHVHDFEIIIRNSRSREVQSGVSMVVLLLDPEVVHLWKQ